MYELVQLTKRFVLFIKTFFTNVKHQKSFVRFQALILLSYCEVLRKRDVFYKTVDRIIEHIFEERDRRKLFSSARWINDVIVDLISHDWTIYRITELFFIDVFLEILCNVTMIMNTWRQTTSISVPWHCKVLTLRILFRESYGLMFLKSAVLHNSLLSASRALM